MNADKPEQAEHESPPGPQTQSEPPASVYQPELSFIHEQIEEAEHLNSAEHSDHPHQTMSELRAQREIWAAKRLQRFSLWVGLASFAAFWGMLWLGPHLVFKVSVHYYGSSASPFDGSPGAVWGICVVTFALGLIWLSCVVAAIVGVVLPRTRKRMLVPLLVHLVLLVLVIPVVRVAWQGLINMPR